MRRNSTLWSVPETVNGPEAGPGSASTARGARRTAQAASRVKREALAGRMRGRGDGAGRLSMWVLPGALDRAGGGKDGPSGAGLIRLPADPKVERVTGRSSTSSAS